jgi:Metallo-peptidase family M12B Reprolysin-like/SprB repeat/Dockerin type I domain
MNSFYGLKKKFPSKKALLALYCMLFSAFVLMAQSDAPLEKKFTIDFAAFKAKLQPAVELRGASERERDVVVELPTPEGDLKKFKVIEIHIMSAQMEAQFPDIKNYKIFDVNNPKHSGTITTSMLGINATIYGEEGIYFIEILDKKILDEYKIYYNKREGIECGSEIDIKPEGGASMDVEFRSNSCFQNGGTLKTYRMAIAVTDEYRDGIGGGTIAGTIAAINNTINAINAIYERELSIRFVIAGTPFITPLGSTDGFTPQSAAECTAGSEPSVNGRTVQANNVISANFVAATYDIGHVFHQGCGGGLAGGPICSGSKARGWSATSAATGSSWVNLLAHEIGHQFGAAHTFNSQTSGCNGNISTTTAFEPGAGNSIMAYGNICGADNVQGGRIDYFGSHSLQQILGTVNSSGTCAAMTATGNNAPTSNANPTGATYVIPKGTKFTLTGAGTDPDGDNLTYSWEQYDAGNTTTPPTPPTAGATLTTGPLFQMLPPSSSPSRTFTDNPLGETLPQTGRTMNFRLVVRDNHTDGTNGANTGVACDQTSVTVANVGPFVVTSQNTATTWVANNSNMATITWDIGGTTANGINCANVKILFSTDGGQTFPYTLIASTPNDGTHDILIPSYPTTQGRIKILCADGNVFFDTNDANITITSACSALAAPFTALTAVTAELGNGALNLGLTAQYGTLLPNFTGSISASDPTMRLTFKNFGGSCAAPYSNSPHYKTFSFQVNQSENYSFDFGATTLGGATFNLYQNSFSSTSTCTNWIASSRMEASAGGNINSLLPAVVTLSKGVIYTLVVSGFDTPDVGDFIVNVTPTAGGQLYSNTPNPGAAFSYTYAVVNKATGNIVAFQADSDLTNTGTYPVGMYTVYGVSYKALESALLNSYVGGSYTNFQSAVGSLAICANIANVSKSVTINCIAPSVAPTPAAATVCIGNTVVINGTPTGGSGTYSTHTWTITNAGTTGITAANLASANTQSVSVNATGLTPGTATLNYTVTDNVGCPKSGTATVTIDYNAGVAAASATTLSCSGTTNVNLSSTGANLGSDPMVGWWITPTAPTVTSQADLDAKIAAATNSGAAAFTLNTTNPNFILESTSGSPLSNRTISIDCATLGNGTYYATPFVAKKRVAVAATTCVDSKTSSGIGVTGAGPGGTVALGAITTTVMPAACPTNAGTPTYTVKITVNSYTGGSGKLGINLRTNNCNFNNTIQSETKTGISNGSIFTYTTANLSNYNPLVDNLCILAWNPDVTSGTAGTTLSLTLEVTLSYPGVPAINFPTSTYSSCVLGTPVAITCTCTPCATITTPSADQTLCTGAAGANITVATTNNVKFVKFTSDQVANNATPNATELGNVYGGTAIATVTPSGGAATYTFAASDFPNATNAPITYYVYAILNPDAGASCRPFQEIKVTVNPKPVIDTQPIAQTKCVGTAASFTVVATTGAGTLTYQWQKNGTDISGATSATYNIASVAAADAGNYSVIISNNGVGGTCNITSSAVALAVDAQPTTAIAGSNQPLCNTSTFTLAGNTPATGIGTWSLVSGTGTITTPSSNTSTVTGVTTTATLRWTIANGVCTASPSNVVLTNNPNPTITAIAASEVCYGATKTITVAAAGTGTLQYAICTGAACTNFGANQSSNTFTQGAGDYVVQVTDGNGCKATTPVSITQPSAALAITTTTNASVLCKGGSTGSLTLNPQGGTEPYTFKICAGASCANYADPKTAALVSNSVIYGNLTAGIYNIEITDSKGCKAIKQETITEPAAVTATVTPTAATSCTVNDGKIDITAVSGGTGTYTYLLNSVVQSSANLTGLAPNTYTVAVRDGNGCLFTTMTTITSPSSPTAFTVTSDSTKICVGQSTKIKLSGSQTGVTYQLLLNGANAAGVATIAGTGAAIQFTNISGQGTYSVKATDASSCMTTMTGTPALLVNPYSPAPVVNTPGAVCENGTYTITPTANATYPIEFLYDFTGNSIAAAISGTGAPLAYAYSLGTNATGGFAGGGYTVSGINSGATDRFIEIQVSPFNAANLTITEISFDIFKDANGASAYELRYSLDGFTTALSSGTIATASATKTIIGSYVSPASGITFRLYLTGATTNTGIVTLDNIKLKGTTSLPGTLEYYSDAALTMKIGTGASQVINAASTPSTSTTGAKKVYVAHLSAANCLSAATEVTINVNSLPTLTIVNPTAVCSPSTVDITAATVQTANDGTTTKYYSTNPLANAGAAGDVTTPTAIAASGIYYIRTESATGCFVVKPVTVTINPLPTLTIVNPTAVCSPSTVNITTATVQTANTGTTTNYYSTIGLANTGGAGDITVVQAAAIATSGTYYIRAELATGCFVVKSVIVTINPLPILTITDPTAVCSPSTVDITAATVQTANTGTTTKYYTTNPLATAGGASDVTTPTAITASGIYYIRTESATGCFVVKPVTVTINPLPILTIVNPTAVCSPSTVNITTTAVQTANTGTTTNYYSTIGLANTGGAGDITVVQAAAIATSGTYYIRTELATGCFVVKPVIVTINPLPTLVITNVPPICAPNTANITTSSVQTTNTGITTTYYSTSALANTGGTGDISAAQAAAIAVTGTYYIRTELATGCFVVQPVSVTINALPTATASTTSATCIAGTTNANADGKITIGGTFTTEKFAYTTGATYTGGITTFAAATAIPIGEIIVNNLTNPAIATQYTVRIFNSDNCYIDRVVTLNPTNCTCTAPILAALTTETICVSGTFTPANVTTSVSNAVAVTYQWYNDNGTDNPIMTAISGETSATLATLPTAAGSYNYRVEATSTANASCKTSQSVNLIVLSAPTTTAAATDATCIAGTSIVNSDGKIKLNGFSASDKYDYKIDAGAFTGTQTAIPVGGEILTGIANPLSVVTYTIRIYSSTKSGCFVDRVVMLNPAVCTCINPALVALTDETICVGGTFTAAKVTTSVTNAVAVTYKWYNDNGANNANTNLIAGQTTAALTALPSTAGVYKYKVEATRTDDATCKSTQSVTLTIVALPTITATATNATCNGLVAFSDAKIVLSTLSGEKYDFMPGTSYTNAAMTYATATNPTMTGLANPAAGTPQSYTIRIFNSNNCYVDRTVTISNTNCSCTVVANNITRFTCATVFPAGTTGIFNLNRFKTAISTTAGATITFYPTLTDAQNGTNIITNPTAYNTANTTIIAKVANAANTCANYATITLRVLPCRIRITDPCACRNNATTPTNGQFNETIEVEAAAGQNWFIQTVSGLYKSTSTATNLVPFVTGAAGEQFVDLGAIGVGGLNVYQLKGAHVDAIGYDITVENADGSTLSLPRTICYYPRINVGSLPSSDCKGGGGPFTFNASAPNATIAYELDGVALASPNVGNVGVGSHTLTIIADAGAPTANNPNDPGCIVRQTVQFSIANPNLTPDCKGYMTLSLGNCQDKLYPQQLLNSFNVNINDLTLELRDKNGNILPNNFITAAQVGQEVYAKLTYGCNGKTCETVINVQDNNAPTAYSPEDGVITCTQYRELLAKGEFTPKKLAELFGNFSANDNCAANLAIIEGISTDSVRINDCVNRGFILRTFSAQEKYGYRRIAKTTQKITFLNDQNFRVKFPPNKDVKCTEPLAKLTPVVEGVGCENVQVNYRDEVFTSSTIGEAKQCYKIIRHWTVINMCRFNPTRNNYLPEGDADINYDYSFVKDTIIANYFTDARGVALNDNVLSKIDATTTTGFSPLLTAGAATLSNKLTFNPNIIAGTRTVGFVVDGRIKEDVIYIRDYSGDGVIRYTQILNIVDDEAPTFAACPKEMQTLEGTNFTNDCRATVTMQTSATDNCSAIDKITYSYIIKPFNTSLETDWIKGSTNRFSDVLPITNITDKSHTMTWRATDACGNTRECSFPFRVLDGKKPNITAQNISASFMENNTISLGVRKFVLMGTDNCTPMSRLRFSFSDNVNDTIRLFTCKDYPSNVVKIYVTDEANNQAFAEATIKFAATLNSVNCNEISFSTVSGSIFNSQGVPLSATTSIILDNQPSTNDDVIGNKFSFKLRNGGTYIVQPRRNNDLLNGVTTYDIVQIQQHILDVNQLDNPYKIIAADVNKDGKVTTLDVLELRKAILRLTYQFTNNNSWRFLQKSYTFKDINNPITEDLPEYYKLTNLNGNKTGLDFIGVKIGDVNENAQGNFSNEPVVEVRNRPDAIHFVAEDRLVQPQEIVTIQVKSEGQLDLNGFQTTLHFDENAMVFEGITPNALPISPNNIGIFNGLVTMSWNANNTMRFAKEEGLFTLTFRAKKAILLSDALFSSSQYTVSEIYTLKNNDLSVVSPLEIAFTKTNETALTDALYQNVPNPFEGETTLSFRLAKAQKVTISITDAVGKVLQVIQQDAFAGYNELKINNLPTKGVLFYHLATPTFKASKKMVSAQ